MTEVKKVIVETCCYRGQHYLRAEFCCRCGGIMTTAEGVTDPSGLTCCECGSRLEESTELEFN
jgi:hypothetical protein